MALYPITPVPSSVSVAAMHDPVHAFTSDQGYEARRSRYPRQLRSVQLAYLGITTADVRYLKFFIAHHRVSALPFEAFFYYGWDTCRFDATTPVTLILYHNFVSGQWVTINDATAPSVNGTWKVYVYNELVIGLVGSTSPGVTGECSVRAYYPKLIFDVGEDGVYGGVEKLIGPESTDSRLVGQGTSVNRGRFNMNVSMREVF